MNVLQLVITKGWGGGGVQMMNLCTEISTAYPEINMSFLCARNTKFHQRLAQTEFSFETAPMLTKVDPRFIRKLIQVCRKKKIDLIHIHGPSALMVAIIADKMKSLPPFVFSKKTSFPIRKRKQTRYKYNYPKIKKIICVSEKVREVTLRAVQNKNIPVTVYDGLVLNSLSTKTPFQLRDKLNLKPHVKVIGNIGNHMFAKDLDTFIEVARILVHKHKCTDFHFVQMGTFSEDTPPLLQKIEQLDLKDHVSFMGYTENAANFIPQFNITLITSVSEGLPLVVYESFYHKVPVVSTNVGGIPEVIKHNINGLLTEPRDAKMLVAHIKRLADDTELAEKFTSRSFDKLIPEFTASTMAANTVGVYKEALNLDNMV